MVNKKNIFLALFIDFEVKWTNAKFLSDLGANKNIVYFTSQYFPEKFFHGTALCEGYSITLITKRSVNLTKLHLKSVFVIDRSEAKAKFFVVLIQRKIFKFRTFFKSQYFV